MGHEMKLYILYSHRHHSTFEQKSTTTNVHSKSFPYKLVVDKRAFFNLHTAFHAILGGEK